MPEGNETGMLPGGFESVDKLYAEFVKVKDEAIANKTKAAERKVKGDHARAAGKAGRDYSTKQAVSLGLQNKVTQHQYANRAAKVAKVAKASGPHARTVAEVVGGKSALKDKPVVVRGQVVKFNGGIMGKNWIHVRDGSGSDGSNDLTVTTTTAQPNVGDTVLITGPLVLNKDFGMGYQYDVIVEDAQVTIETTAAL
jgi:hypothetical protein